MDLDAQTINHVDTGIEFPHASLPFTHFTFTQTTVVEHAYRSRRGPIYQAIP